MVKRIIRNPFILLLLFALPVKAQTYVFAQLQGTPLNTAGWNLSGAAKVTNVTGTGNGELLLTSAVNGTSGAIFYSQPINLSMCQKWKAEFDCRLFDGTGADGIAFCFLDVPPSGYVNGGGLGIPDSANGLKICIDTWNNCTTGTDHKVDMPKVEIRWGIGYGGECSDQPTAKNIGSYLSFLRSKDYVHVLITYDAGNITVTAGGKPIITAFQEFNFSGYLGFTGSTGGSNDNQSIKNVVIYTEMPPSVAGQSAHPVCPTDTVHLGTTNNATYSYSWQPSTGLSSTNVSNPIATVDNNTGDILYQKYFVHTAYIANPGCNSTDSVTIKVNPKPLTDFAVPVVCLPQGSVTINNKTVIKDGTQNQVTYNWTFSDGGTSTQTNAIHNYNTQGNYSIDLLATSVNGCKNDVNKSFVINPKAKASITVQPEFCEDTALEFSGSCTAATLQKWRWNFGDNTVDSVQNPSHTYSSANTFTIKMYAITAEGCYSDTASSDVTINPLPKAVLSYSGVTCENNVVHFKDISQPSIGTISQRTWYFDDGTQSANQTVDHTYKTYGTYPVKLQVQNSKGCISKPYSQNITINAVPSVNFATPSICKGVNGTFTDNSTIADGTQSQFAYNWVFGDGATSSGNQPSHTYASPGNYTVNLIVTSNNGCVDSLSKIFAVSDYPVIDLQILNTDFCGNLPLQLKDNSSVSYGNLDAIKIYWDASQAAFTNVNNPVQGTVYTHNYATFGYTNSLQVTLKVQAFSSGQCYTEKTGTSILFASPKLVFNAIPLYCQNNNQSIVLNEAKDTTVFPGSGVYSGDGVSNGSFNPSLAGAGIHTIFYKYTLVNGCSDTVSQTVTVAVQPKVFAGQPAVILNGGQIVLQGAANGGNNLSYSWTPNTYLSDNTILQPIAMPLADTYYTLKATNDEGCFDTAGVLISVLQFPGVPNAFSPNGDGINDTWQITSLSSYPDCIVEVFNRNGQQVFHSTGYSTPWNGKYNGTDLPVGTYYYIIATKHLPKPLSGSVTILR